MATWLVLHNKDSNYGDVIGKTYEYPIGIPNSRNIKVGDDLVFCLTKKSSKDDKRILGFGKINEIEPKQPILGDKRKRLAAHLINYKSFNPPLTFWQIGGDTRTNKTNSINRIELNLGKLSPNFETIPNDDFLNKQNYAKTIRNGQYKFRKQLLDQYGHCCAICGHGPDSVLDACHILPHNVSGINQINNGLLLRSDLHNLFDDGLIKINPETFKIELDISLLKTPYAKYDGIQLREGKDGSMSKKEFLILKYRA